MYYTYTHCFVLYSIPSGFVLFHFQYYLCGCMQNFLNVSKCCPAYLYPSLTFYFYSSCEEQINPFYLHACRPVQGFALCIAGSQNAHICNVTRYSQKALHQSSKWHLFLYFCQKWCEILSSHIVQSITDKQKLQHPLANRNS